MKAIIFVTFLNIISILSSKVPMVINTWHFEEATKNAWESLKQGESGIDAIEAGCSTCERLQCDGTVGYGGSPDEHGETTLDALIFDGTTMDMGAVGALRGVKDAVSVAKLVLQHTSHSLLVGDQATDFAKQMGFKVESLTTKHSKEIWHHWRDNQCQPNSWQNVKPDSKSHCGPYNPIMKNDIHYEWHYKEKNRGSETNHDTIGMVVIDNDGNIVSGTSTNGMTHKIPGRVGDSPIPGAGAYANSQVGGACATGDGDIMMRFLPSFLAVESMMNGFTPTQAAQFSIDRITDYYPNFFGGVVAVNKTGDYGAACNGMDEFTYCVVNGDIGKVNMVKVNCKKN